MERLQKLIAQSGITSRRKAEQLIVDGRVKVNGELVTELGAKAKRSDVIMVDGSKNQKISSIVQMMKKTVTLLRILSIPINASSQ